MFFYLR